MGLKSNKKINFKYIEKFNDVESHNREIIDKKILKGSNVLSIDKEVIDDVFTLNTSLKNKIKFFYYLLKFGYVDEKDYSLLRDKLCDSNTWGRVRLSDVEIDFLIEIYSYSNMGGGQLYECDEMGIRYIEKIEKFLTEDSGLTNNDLIKINFDSLKKKVYSLNIVKYFNELLELDETKIKDKIIDTFEDVNYEITYKIENLRVYECVNFLHICQNIESDEKALKYTKIFLEMGVNPNKRMEEWLDITSFRRLSLIDIALLKKRDFSYIYNLIKECLKYGLEYKNILSDIASKNYTCEDVLKGYKLLLEEVVNNNGVLPNIIIEKYKGEKISHDELEKINSYVFFIGSIYEIKQQFNLMKYEIEINYNDFVVENASDFNLLIIYVQELSKTSDNEFYELICKNIIEERNRNIAPNDKKLKIEEIIDSLKKIKNDSIEKINIGYNRIYEKVLTYKN